MKHKIIGTIFVTVGSVCGILHLITLMGLANISKDPILGLCSAAVCLTCGVVNLLIGD